MIQLEENEFGYFFNYGPFAGGFGNRKGTLEVLRNLFPDFQFFGVKQTHSDIAHVFNHEPSGHLEADAIIGHETQVAFYIKTADCVPVLLFDTRFGTVAAIHAGWRGVANRIIPKTIQKLFSLNQGCRPHLVAIIGPHIQKPSFEIELNVLNQIKKSVANWPEDAAHSRDSKFYVDLNLIVKTQLEELGLQADQVHSLMIDTKTDLNFHSYRRDQDASGRQISFIGRRA